MAVRLSAKQSLAWNILDPVDPREVVLYGGSAGGGKTYFGCTWQLTQRVSRPNTRSVIGRKARTDLLQTTYLRFIELYREYYDGTRPSNRVTMSMNMQTGQMDFSNGSTIFWRELKDLPGDPDFERLGSFELTDAFIDEAGQINEKAANILFTRIRYNLPRVMVGGELVPRKKMLLASNPSRNFLKGRFVSDLQGKPVVLHPKDAYVQATVWDNPDEIWAKAYADSLARLPLYDRLRLLDGDWEVTENDNPFYYEYRSDMHMGDVQPDPYEPLWLSFDFNLEPTTCVIGQKLDGRLIVTELFQVNGGTEYLCDALIEAGILSHGGGIFVTGDSSGIAGSSSAGMEPDGRHKSDWSIIQKKLMIPDQFFIQAYEANKRLTYSRKLCNYVFKNAPLTIDQDAKVLHTDLQTGMANDKGGLVKNRDQHKQDAGDAFRYLVNAWFPGGLTDVDKWLGA